MFGRPLVSKIVGKRFNSGESVDEIKIPYGKIFLGVVGSCLLFCGYNDWRYKYLNKTHPNRRTFNNILWPSTNDYINLLKEKESNFEYIPENKLTEKMIRKIDKEIPNFFMNLDEKFKICWVCRNFVKINPKNICHLPDGIVSCIASNNSSTFPYIDDKYKTDYLCKKAVDRDIYNVKFLPRDKLNYAYSLARDHVFVGKEIIKKRIQYQTMDIEKIIDSCKKDGNSVDVRNNKIREYLMENDIFKDIPVSTINQLKPSELDKAMISGPEYKKYFKNNLVQLARKHNSFNKVGKNNYGDHFVPLGTTYRDFIVTDKPKQTENLYYCGENDCVQYDVNVLDGSIGQFCDYGIMFNEVELKNLKTYTHSSKGTSSERTFYGSIF